MAKLILVSDDTFKDISRLGVPIIDSKDTSAQNLLGTYSGEDVLAMKVWSEEDVLTGLREMGFKESKENIEKLDLSLMKHLEDCTDEEWNVIYNTIEEADGLERK